MKYIIMLMSLVMSTQCCASASASSGSKPTQQTLAAQISGVAGIIPDGRGNFVVNPGSVPKEDFQKMCSVSVKDARTTVAAQAQLASVASSVCAPVAKSVTCAQPASAAAAMPEEAGCAGHVSHQNSSDSASASHAKKTSQMIEIETRQQLHKSLDETTGFLNELLKSQAEIKAHNYVAGFSAVYGRVKQLECVIAEDRRGLAWQQRYKAIHQREFPDSRKESVVSVTQMKEDAKFLENEKKYHNFCLTELHQIAQKLKNEASERQVSSQQRGYSVSRGSSFLPGSGSMSSRHIATTTFF